MTLLYLVLIEAYYSFIMEQNALRSKLKLQEEELKYQKKILEIE
jgi:hypothetical protein